MSKLWSTFHGKRKTYASAFYQNISGVEVVRRNVAKTGNSTDLTAKQIEACAIKSKFVNFATRHIRCDCYFCSGAARCDGHRFECLRKEAANRSSKGNKFCRGYYAVLAGCAKVVRPKGQSFDRNISWIRVVAQICDCKFSAAFTFSSWEYAGHWIQVRYFSYFVAFNNFATRLILEFAQPTCLNWRRGFCKSIIVVEVRRMLRR